MDVAVVAKLVVDMFRMPEEIRAGVSISRLGRREDLDLTVVYVSVLKVNVVLEVDMVFKIKRDIIRAVFFSVLEGMLVLIVLT